MSTTGPYPHSTIKVFLVDDSRIVREHLVIMIEELAGIEIVGQAGSVKEAIGKLGELQPDVVILDLRMPDGSGIDVLHKIKQDGLASMIIILTNYTFAGYRQKCLDAGADFFLDKSTEFDQIPKLFKQLNRTLP